MTMTKRDRRSVMGLFLASKILLGMIVMLLASAGDEVRSKPEERKRPREESPEKERPPEEPVAVTKVQLVSVPPPATDAEEPAPAPPPPAEAEEPETASPPTTDAGEPEAPAPPATDTEELAPASPLEPGSVGGKPVGPATGADLGSFPEILADYQSIGFDRYWKGMTGAGARYFIIERPAFRILAEVSPNDFELMAVDRVLDDFSPRTREIGAEPGLRTVLEQAAREYGEGDYAVAALLPNHLERRLMRELHDLARDVPAGVDSFLCQYRLEGNSIALHVLQMRAKDGATVAADRSIPLGTGY